MDGGPSPDDLSVLDPTPRRVTLASGMVVDVLPITVRQLVPFVRALGPSREAMAKPEMDIWVLIALYGEEITAALSVALAMPVSAIECLSPGDYMACLNAMLEANRDFFGSWLLRPTMAAAARKSEQSGDGQMLSSPSSTTTTTPIES
jgi:hypothetical protein